MGDSVKTTRDGATLVISIDRPPARNAIDATVAQAIEEALEELDRDDALRVGVLTGSGGFFSAGMDLKAFARGESGHTERGGFAGIVKHPPRKPLIAAIEGFALAGGLEIALACDLIVAARDASLGVPEVAVGLIPAAGALFRLPRRIPHGQAMAMALTGAPIDAERAFEIGLVDRLAEPGGALDASLELARTIAAKAPLAVVAAKRSLLEVGDWSTADAWRRQEEIAAPIEASADALEGARAFAERRPPEWRGH